jgi:hypothetical protein
MQELLEGIREGCIILVQIDALCFTRHTNILSRELDLIIIYLF